MSVEQFVIAALVDEGSVRRAFQAGIEAQDFELYDEEWNWIVGRAEHRKPINTRLFKKAFPTFEFIRSNEKIGDLLDELKAERAFVSVSSAIDEVIGGDTALNQENAIEKAIQLREILGDVVKTHAPHSDVFLKSGWPEHYQRVKQMKILQDGGENIGIPTGLKHFDYYWGGLQGETCYLVLGRPGDAKSFTLGKFATEAAWDRRRVGFFSPEMTEHQHNCRFHTLLSAKPEIQKALGLRKSFRNRDLKHGTLSKVELFSYKKFLEWLEAELPGEICLFTQKYRRERMTVGYIQSRIEELGLDAVIIDPIYKLKSPKKRGSRWEELNDIVDSLTNLAHEFNIPVVMSNQANRALVGKRGEAPDKDSSFGADSPVQEANTVVGVKYFNDEKIMKYNCTKNRDGESFRFEAVFVPNIGKLEDGEPNKMHYDREKLHELDQVMNGKGEEWEQEELQTSQSRTKVVKKSSASSKTASGAASK